MQWGKACLKALTVVLAPVMATAGCSSNGTTGSADDAAQTDDLQAGAYTYYATRLDTRKCAAPACGGYWVSKVNATSTKCADGSSAAECYVADIDLSGINVTDATAQKALGLVGSGATRLVVRGRITKKSFSGAGKLGVFDATEAWQAPAASTHATLTAPFHKITDSGIRCVKAPCNSFVAKELDTSSHAAFTSIDFSGAPAAASTQSRAESQAESSTGILASGSISGGVFAVDQFFLMLADGKVEGDQCGADADCADGLVCCYPCGVQGCHDVCTTPSSSGTCPLHP